MSLRHRKFLENEEEIFEYFLGLTSESEDDSSENDEPSAAPSTSDENNSFIIVNEDLEAESPDEDEDEYTDDMVMPPEEDEDTNDENWADENNWEEFDEERHELPRFTFKGRAKFNCPDQTINTPLQFFMLFFTRELFQTIAVETNRYTEELISRKRPLQQYSIWQNWQKISVEEMMAFHGTIINMALHRNKRSRDSFSKQWVDESSFFRQIFRRDRWFQIFWGLHVSPPAPPGSGFMASRRSKVKQVHDYLSERFLHYYHPGCHLSVDESTVPFKGRTAFKMYDSKKPTKWGIRIYDIADALTVYILGLIPYYGKATIECLGYAGHLFTTRIVLTLVDIVTRAPGETGYHVYTDRLYTNLSLVAELLKKKNHITGTINTNRKGLPPQVKKRKRSSVGTKVKQTPDPALQLEVYVPHPRKSPTFCPPAGCPSRHLKHQILSESGREGSQAELEG
ncbi:piggyBac transposable element-derived protein 4-like [Palaemon carinicauda]|uniref:piggyBac transposable element-derived protein 4-like n=1 Tax=Palaemon carinicauda TaxID=392227 RepID=UPI0035B62977